MPTHTFALDEPIHLVVRIGHGSVTVRTADDPTKATVRVEAGKNADELLDQTVVELRGGELVVAAPRQGGLFDLPFLSKFSGRTLDVHVTVPVATDVKISTFTAPIRIVGDVGVADLSFGSGEAGVRHARELRLRFGSGTAKAVRVDGAVQLRSGSGNAELGEVGGALSSGCGSGDLNVRVARGPVRLRTGSGTARLREVHGDVDATTGAGAVEIGVPQGVSAEVDLHAGSGRITTDLPIEDAPRSSSPVIRLRARTGSGDLRLFRAE